LPSWGKTLLGAGKPGVEKSDQKGPHQRKDLRKTQTQALEAVSKGDETTGREGENRASAPRKKSAGPGRPQITSYPAEKKKRTKHLMGTKGSGSQQDEHTLKKSRGTGFGGKDAKSFPRN